VQVWNPYDTRIKDGAKVRIIHTGEEGIIDGEPYYFYQQASVRFNCNGNRVYSFNNFEVLEEENNEV
jgi:hypothetical protein